MSDENDGRRWYPAVISRNDKALAGELAAALFDTFVPLERASAVAVDAHRPTLVELRRVAMVMMMAPYGGRLDGGWGGIEWREAPESDVQGAIHGGARVIHYCWT